MVNSAIMLGGEWGCGAMVEYKAYTPEISCIPIFLPSLNPVLQRIRPHPLCTLHHSSAVQGYPQP
jgi:hypothetical protein